MRLDRSLGLGLSILAAACSAVPSDGDYEAAEFELATGSGLTGQYWNN